MNVSDRQWNKSHHLFKTYFTAGPDEVIKYDDFVSPGSENAVKEAGRMSVEGKEYVVQDAYNHYRKALSYWNGEDLFDNKPFVAKMFTNIGMYDSAAYYLGQERMINPDYDNDLNYHSALLALARRKQPNEEDMKMLTYLVAGFSMRTVCLFCGLKEDNNYARKKRLMDRLKQTDPEGYDILQRILKRSPAERLASL